MLYTLISPIAVLIYEFPLLYIFNIYIYTCITYIPHMYHIYNNILYKYFSYANYYIYEAFIRIQEEESLQGWNSNYRWDKTESCSKDLKPFSSLWNKYFYFFKTIQWENYSSKSWYPNSDITNQRETEHICIFLVSLRLCLFDLQSFIVKHQPNENKNKSKMPHLILLPQHTNAHHFLSHTFLLHLKLLPPLKIFNPLPIEFSLHLCT